jgi:hypothetical protein
VAAKLAADINALEAGKATASGDTVTLTGGVRLETALTVPEGVTLDLTKETLQLGNGATLTVNGTVNAKAEGITIDSAAASPATINGVGTIQLQSKGRLLLIVGNKKLILDGVTLLGLPDNDKSVVEMGDGGEFVLKSGAITGNTRVGEWVRGSGVEVREGGLFTMEGGGISGNSASGEASQGGGVFVRDGGSTFIMSGGTISGNSAIAATEGGFGGGVEVSDGATFTMSGGTISGNSATGKIGSLGGGVYVEGSATFTMQGGAISANTAKGGTNENSGGGVRVENGSAFIMEGGTIYGKAGSLPAGTNASLANSAESGVSLSVDKSTAKWGMGGTYTAGGKSQSGGGDVGSTDDTLIAVPAK